MERKRKSEGGEAEMGEPHHPNGTMKQWSQLRFPTAQCCHCESQFIRLPLLTAEHTLAYSTVRDFKVLDPRRLCLGLCYMCCAHVEFPESTVWSSH